METGPDQPATPAAESSPGNEARPQLDAAAGQPVVFFDGVCGLCNRTVDFILAHDPEGRLRFSPLQGETARRLLDATDTDSLGTLVLLDEQGAHRRSTAVVRILRKLGGSWGFLGALLWLIPRPLRDLGYRLVARSRYRWFGKKEECRMPTAEERTRFLP